MNVHYSTADGTATVADDDYQPADNTITFIAGQQSQTVTVNVVGDTKFEQDEYFFVNWSSGPGGFIPGHQSAVTIVNDDPKPPKTCGLPPNKQCRVSIDPDNPSVTEGNSGLTP